MRIWYSGLGQGSRISFWGVAITGVLGVIGIIVPVVTSAEGKPDAESPSVPSTAAPDNEGTPTATSKAPAPSKPPLQKQQAAYKEVYSGRLLKLRTPRSNECWNSFIDFDKGQVGSNRSRVSVPKEADLSLNRCAGFGLGVQVAAAGASSTSAPSAEQCLEAARQGGIQTVEGYDLLRDEDPIKRGTVLCLETSEGTVVQAVAEEVRWTKLNDLPVEWGVDYTFNATAWEL
ncbi:MULTISPECIES: hypothetical protein [Streptomyces]|uniref:hypothetical protein n=1 Tax=Streptomyces TaxID=1883 RepID=UPI0012FEECCE|nr:MULTISPECIES: hypothetical protein [Streptomyces]